MTLQKIKDIAKKIVRFLIFKAVKYVILPALISSIIISSISAVFLQHIFTKLKVHWLYIAIIDFIAKVIELIIPLSSMALIAFIALCCCFYKDNKKKETDGTVKSIMKSIAQATICIIVFTVIIVTRSCSD